MINANNANAITAIIKAERCLIFDKTAIFIVVNFIFGLRKYNYLLIIIVVAFYFTKKYFYKINHSFTVNLTNSIFLFVASSIIK
jgi:hypothetical protein